MDELGVLEDDTYLFFRFNGVWTIWPKDISSRGLQEKCISFIIFPYGEKMMGKCNHMKKKRPYLRNYFFVCTSIISSIIPIWLFHRCIDLQISTNTKLDGKKELVEMDKKKVGGGVIRQLPYPASGVNVANKFSFILRINKFQISRPNCYCISCRPGCLEQCLHWGGSCKCKVEHKHTNLCQHPSFHQYFSRYRNYMDNLFDWLLRWSKCWDQEAVQMLKMQANTEESQLEFYPNVPWHNSFLCPHRH